MPALSVPTYCAKAFHLRCCGVLKFTCGIFTPSIKVTSFYVPCSSLAHFPVSVLRIFPQKNFLYFLKPHPSPTSAQVLSSISCQKIFLKKFLTFFPEKTCSEKVSYIFSKKASLIFRNFLIFQKRYI